MLVGRLRPRLGPLGGSILTRPPGYLLAVDAKSLDSECFEAGYRSARDLWSADPGTAAKLLDEALALWRGPAYGEFADGFAQPAATRLEELRVSALEDRTALLLQCGSATEAVASAGHLVAQQPLRERPVELLMRALHAEGRTGEALEAYRRHREVLADELGLDPTPGLRELEARILRDEFVATKPQRPPTESTVSTEPTVSTTPAPRTRDLPWRPGAMLGREQDLQLLRECLSAKRLVTLVGPGGVGKTRLALEVAHRFAAEESAVWWADLTSVPAERLVDALAEATGTDIPRAADPAGFLCAALRAHRGLLCLDNAEMLLAELAPVVERLIEAAPGLVILATSRERIAVAHEHVHVLAPLPLPAGADRDNAAVRLFIDRAPGLEPAGLTDDDVSVVAERVPPARRTAAGDRARSRPRADVRHPRIGHAPGPGPGPAGRREAYGRRPAPHPAGRRGLVTRPAHRAGGAPLRTAHRLPRRVLPRPVRVRLRRRATPSVGGRAAACAAG